MPPPFFTGLPTFWVLLGLGVASAVAATPDSSIPVVWWR